MAAPLIHLEAVHKRYQIGSTEVAALSEIDLFIARGEFIAITGPSGSGKSTLMNLIGLLDRPDSGRYILNGVDATNLSDAERSGLRNREIGFVFQNFNLLPRASALRNVALPLSYRHPTPFDKEELALKALETMGLGERTQHRPMEMSGGERQRVAIARALVGNPSLILADEPTGNLDQNTGREIIAILKNLSERGRTIILVTHDPLCAAAAHRTIRIVDGRIA